VVDNEGNVSIEPPVSGEEDGEPEKPKSKK
jgi:hypothetical protein